MPVRKIILNDDNILEILPAREDLEYKKFNQYGCIYLMRYDKVVYKLQQIPKFSKWGKQNPILSEIEGKYFWASIYNSVGLTSLNGVSLFDSIENAINCAVKYANEVIKTDWTYLSQYRGLFKE
jgi:hypothetical protein